MNLLMNVEWEGWQDVVKDFRRAVGEINSSKYNQLVTSIQLWGEHLAALRLTQEEETQTCAMELAEENWGHARK